MREFKPLIKLHSISYYSLKGTHPNFLSVNTTKNSVSDILHPFFSISFRYGEDRAHRCRWPNWYPS